jgi:thiol-disulfide isomerase/thioredoxin
MLIRFNDVAIQRRIFLKNAGLLAGAGIGGLSLASLVSAAGAEDRFDLANYRGSVVYLDFWASWCAPCKLSFKFMHDLRTRYPQNELAIVAINVDRDHAAAQAFIRDNNVTLPVIYDPAGKLAAQYKVATMPTSFGIDRSGQTKFVHGGYFDNKTAEYTDHISALIRANS